MGIAQLVAHAADEFIFCVRVAMQLFQNFFGGISCSVLFTGFWDHLRFEKVKCLDNAVILPVHRIYDPVIVHTAVNFAAA